MKTSRSSDYRLLKKAHPKRKDKGERIKDKSRSEFFILLSLIL
jgi:hypothetical protein